MMKIKINKEYSYEKLKYYLVNEFPKVRFWELGGEKLLAEKNRFTGCYIIAKKKNVVLYGAFPNIQANIIAIILILIGGIIIPLTLYFLLFRRGHKNFEQKIGEAVAKKFSKYSLLNKSLAKE